MFWRRKAQFVASAPKIFGREHRADPPEARVAELERVIGRLTLELEVAKIAFRLVDGRSSRNLR